MIHFPLIQVSIIIRAQMQLSYRLAVSLEERSHFFNNLPVAIISVLPQHHPCFPPPLLKGLPDCSSQGAFVHPTAPCCVALRCWLADHNLIQGNSPLADLLDRGARKVPLRFDEQLAVIIVGGVSLVVELDVVEIDEVSDLFVHSRVPSIFVVLLAEVGSLRSMRYNVCRQQLPQFYTENNQPLLSCPRFHRVVVLPVDIHAVQIVLLHIVRQPHCTGCRIDVFGGRELSCSEGADHYLHPVAIVLLFQKALNLLFRLPEGIVLAKVFERVIPKEDCIGGAEIVSPEGKGDIVVCMEGGKFRDCH